MSVVPEERSAQLGPEHAVAQKAVHLAFRRPLSRRALAVEVDVQRAPVRVSLLKPRVGHRGCPPRRRVARAAAGSQRRLADRALELPPLPPLRADLRLQLGHAAVARRAALGRGGRVEPGEGSGSG